VSPIHARLVGGHAAAVLASGDGEVMAAYRKAAWVRLPGGLVALTAPAVPPGPLHVTLDGPPPAAPGAPVRRVGSRLRVGGSAVELRGAQRWTGPLPDPGEVRRGADLVVWATAAAAAGSALTAAPYREPACHAVARLRDGDLGGAVATLAGLGPGLTPAGDDALAGMLLALRAIEGPGAEPRLGAAVAVAVARTTRLSLALLRCAAAGQALAPVHQLLGAAARGDRAAALAAATAVAEVGATSGADFCYGLRAAIPSRC
jgi:Protein of unknown function (DUF2877)